MKDVIEGKVRVIEHTLIDRVYLCAGPKGDEVDILTNHLKQFRGHHVRITIEDV